MKSIGYHDFRKDKKAAYKRIKVRCAGCNKKGTAMVSFKTHQGQHWLDDWVKCWVECSDCTTHSWYYEDSWNCVSKAIDDWNKGKVSVPKSIMQREKLIRNLKAENRRLRKGGHSK